MRKVKFPFDLDVIDLLTDELKKQVLPANEALKQIDKDRQERAKVRRRVRVAKEEAVNDARSKVNDARVGINRDPALSAANMAIAAAEKLAAANAAAGDAMVVDEAPAVASASVEVKMEEEKKELAAGELVDEPTKRAEEAKLFSSVVSEQLRADQGANFTALYELSAIVTHKGASADGGQFASQFQRNDAEE